MKLGTRIPALVVKEMLTLFKDRKDRLVLIVPPLMQLLIFAFAATLEVKNVSVAIYNRDEGKYGNEIVNRINGSTLFTDIIFLKRQEQIKPVIDEEIAHVAIQIPQDFSRKIEEGQNATLQVILDGRRSNSAQIINGYVDNIVAKYNSEINGKISGLDSTVVVSRNWFNENLLYLWFSIPCLVGILSMLTTLIVTSLSVARERELGTFDQLLVSPLTPGEILIGKSITAIVVGIVEGCLILTVGVLLFGVPFRGSLLILLFAMFIFVMSVVGIGLFISSVSKTQQQAILGAFVFMVPSVTLSGYAAPVENMPHWLQIIIWVNPLEHFLVTVKGLFLKDMPFNQVWDNTWPLIVIGMITLSFAGWFFTRRLD